MFTLNGNPTKEISNKKFFDLIHKKQRVKSLSKKDIARVFSLAKKVMKDLYE